MISVVVVVVVAGGVCDPGGGRATYGKP